MIKIIGLANPISFLDSRSTRRNKFKRKLGIAFTWTEFATLLACSPEVTATAVGLNTCVTCRAVFGQPFTVCFSFGVEGECEVGIVRTRLSCSSKDSRWDQIEQEENFVE